MREHDLQPRRRRRFVGTTDSAHDLSVFPNLAREVVPGGPNQIWNGDIRSVALRSTPPMTRSTSMLSWVASRSQLSNGTTWKYHSISPVSMSRARMQ